MNTPNTATTTGDFRLPFNAASDEEIRHAAALRKQIEDRYLDAAQRPHERYEDVPVASASSAAARA
jgi:hypothetical protein